MTTPILVASHNGVVGFPAAMDILQSGGSALDAVELAAQYVEDNLDDNTVGRGGLPNMLGDVELDALIMDGDTRLSGAVAALKGYPNPIRIARRVMEGLPHALLVGEGAARFAEEVGFETAELRTEQSLRIWQERLGREDPYFQKMRDVVSRLAQDPERASEEYNDGNSVTGTVNFIARDSHGRIAVAASTSGWAWKYPGRVGDTAIVGAGGYADSRYGAAACTGRGEMALRAVTARSVVLYMKMGLPLWNACREAVRELYDLVDEYASGMHIIALDAQGAHAGFSNTRGITYLYQTADMSEPELRPRTYVDALGKAEVRPTLDRP